MFMRVNTKQGRTELVNMNLVERIYEEENGNIALMFCPNVATTKYIEVVEDTLGRFEAYLCER